MSKKGFTLIELMVVIAIIGVLSSVLAPQIFKQINKGRQSAVVSFYNNLKTATSSYYADTEQWPATGATGIGCLTATSQGSCPAGWAGPYIDRWPAYGPWATSTYTWCSGSCGYGAASSRVLTLTGTGSAITNADIIEIDKKIDGGESNTAGVVQYSSGATSCTILISAN